MPLVGPSNVDLAFGSILAHGDQASHLWKSFTCSNTAAGDAFIVAERETLKSFGRMAMTTHSTAMTATSPNKMYSNMDFSLPFCAVARGGVRLSFIVMCHGSPPD